MVGNREERERLRRQRLAQQSSQGSSERRRMIVGYITAGLLAAAVVAGLVVVITSGGDEGSGVQVSDSCENASIATDFGFYRESFGCDNREGTPPPELQFGDLEESAQEAGCVLMLDLPEEGRGHFTDENEGSFESNPPTSGEHYGVPDETGSGATADGAYTEAIPHARTVHALEHGRVAIWYSPDLPEDQQLALKGVFDEDPGGIIMMPDPELPYAVAFSAWNNAVGCKNFDPLVVDVARNFRDTFRGNGPENVPFL
ncbi:MAG: DUF3105 domain-containing protein [Actinobacteria bacterium]|nr:DUF3105 domain-containing protein [Actinomycetota bacterium]